MKAGNVPLSSGSSAQDDKETTPLSGNPPAETSDSSVDAAEPWVVLGEAAGAISFDVIKDFDQKFLAEPKNVLARNAVTKTSSVDVLANREKLQQINYSFSKKVTELKVTNQKASGRCWIFACLNVLRTHLAEKYKLADDFELSQSYLFFWDKFEKCNYLLENILATSDEDADSRVVNYLLTDPTCDGGQWDMLINLVNKYGVVPKSVYQETDSSSASRRLNIFLLSKLREYSFHLRELKHSGAKDEEIQAQKKKYLEEIYRVMVIHLGNPPVSFDWAFHSKDKEYKRICGLTPQKFFREIVDLDLSNTVSLVNDPRNEYNATYTVDKLGNVVGGRPVLYLNLTIDDLKLYAKKTIDAGKPVWFGCDVGKDLLRTKAAIMDIGILDYDLVYGTKCTLSKAQRLIYKESMMTHAMVFTGYDEETPGSAEGDNIKIAKWRVENSWGNEDGDSGFYIMTDSWFNEHMYQVVVDKSILSPEHLAALEKKPVVLPPWDPMGALA